MRRLAAALLLVAAPLAAGTPRVLAAPSSSAIESRRAAVENLHHQLQERRALLHFQVVRAADLHRQLAETSAGIVQVNARLGEVGRRIAATQRSLAWNRLQVAAAGRSLALHDAAMRRRLVDIYEHGALGELDVLLSARSFSDFVERWDDLRFVVAADQRTIRERRSAAAKVAAARAALTARENGLDDSERAQSQARAQLAALGAERAQLVAAADTQTHSVQTQVAQLEDLSAAQEAQLEALIRERQQAEAARIAAEQAARRRAAALAGVALPPETESGAPAEFSWPVSGPITSPFGMRPDPFGHGGFEMHTGIDIGAPMGATVTAAAAGRIIYAGWYGGYGNAIIIDHGGETSTLYGHLSQIFVSVGQEVERGQAIGAVGSTGMSTGPHLHFEIRVNGVAVDPTTRLR